MKKYLFTLLSIAFMVVSCKPAVQMYTIETTLGDIKVKLYDKTPLHQKNFEKLVSQHYYDSILFHRVIKGFMIQTGNGDTKSLKNGERASSDGDLGYKVDAEFVPEYFHKKGAMAAARVADQINPQKRSSCSQFYIVQGRTYSGEELDMLEEESGIKFPQYQRDIYKSVGGTPFLDQNYTVFGEVVEGMDVVDKIASVRTGRGDWPVEDVRIIKIKKK